MSVLFSKLDFDVICRICLQFNQESKCIISQDIVNMLHTCQFLQVHENDGLPEKICRECEKLLEQCYIFKQKCVSSLNILHKILEESDLSNLQDININKHNEDNNIYSCTTCNKIFSNLQIFKDHNSVHGKEICLHTQSEELQMKSKYKEIDLERTQPKENSENFIDFLEEKGPPPLAYKCSDCSESFENENDFTLHRLIHTSDELICDRCHKKFTNRQLLKRHIKTHMIVKNHICHECGKGFSESHALTKHLKVHMGIPRAKNHACEECGQRFSEPFYLKVHMRKHTGERPLICPICNKSFADPRSLKTHNLTHTGEKPFKCHLCLKSFSQSVNLTKHIRVHTGEKPYVCNKCGKSFAQSTTLNKHLRTHTGEKPFSCEKCDKKYADKSSLIQHIRSHTGERPFNCQVCEKAFYTKSELKLHNRKHSGEKKNVCHICGKHYARPSNLQIHSRTHTGEKPYICKFCNRCFADKSTFRKHSKLHKQKEIENYVS